MRQTEVTISSLNQTARIVAPQMTATNHVSTDNNLSGSADQRQNKLQQCVDRAEAYIYTYPMDKLPETAKQILNGPWKKLLTIILLREGEESTRWNDSTTLSAEIVECLLADATPAARHRLISNIPHLRRKLLEGFAYISYPAADTNKLLNDFQMCCIRSMRRS